jgi:ATP-binding cassette, subfamily B (MDR/TAP), member 1
MLGIAFAAQGVAQFGSFSEAFTASRVAVYEAQKAINRKPGSPEEIIYKTDEDDDLGTTSRSKRSKADAEEPSQVIKAILPKYEIDSTSTAGLKSSIKGEISVIDLHFTYPTRPTDPVLKGFNVEIAAGQTVAFVGRSGSGKSTIVSLLERFYDPQSGSIMIDGVNIKDFNVSHLRSSIGYVGQEPTLFATTIRGNIRYGKPGATDEEVEAAARLANAHDFIVSFSDGYNTQVGDKGSQLSGGQKQRIAIARVLVADPRVLLLDEATSALDSESELVVQDALDSRKNALRSSLPIDSPRSETRTLSTSFTTEKLSKVARMASLWVKKTTITGLFKHKTERTKTSVILDPAPASIVHWISPGLTIALRVSHCMLALLILSLRTSLLPIQPAR